MSLDSNIKSKALNNTYLKSVEIFNKLFKKMNIIEIQNLVVTWKKGHFKFMGKNKSVTVKSKCRSRFD